ncbi:MAG TPA: helix-turn-helix domain-containing protein [Acidimicrobiales bacterium]|nr:helix-turn-helix domain-containing protein [Acidimicrobiales bacterium]
MTTKFPGVTRTGTRPTTEDDMEAATQETKREKPRRPYLTVSEVADLFHVSSKTVVRWANDGKLPYMATLGGHRRFPRDAVEALVADQQRGLAELA